MNWKRKRVMTAKSLLDNGLLKLLADVLHPEKGAPKISRSAPFRS